ncbi:hypothetical protein DQ04_24831000, partial [Trypanosoma grayi]|uniref:hypothetical protein n=1 Tax=Trypanosoma grayi TaxID=71804 RepID=UPI0004F48462
ARHVLCVCVLALCCASLCVAAGGTTGETSCNGTEPTEGQGCENTAEVNDAEEESRQGSGPKLEEQKLQGEKDEVADNTNQECAKKPPPEDKTCVKSVPTGTQQQQLQASRGSQEELRDSDRLPETSSLEGDPSAVSPKCTEEQEEQTAASGTKACVAKDPTKEITQQSSKSDHDNDVKSPTEHGSPPDPEKQHSVSGSTPGALGPPPA